MQPSAILEVAIGLITAWLIVSITTSQIQEFFAVTSGSRSKFLEKQIREMLGDKEMYQLFYEHPLILPLYEPHWFGGKRTPSNISNETFAKAAIYALINRGKPNKKPINLMTLEELKKLIDAEKGVSQNNIQPPGETGKATPAIQKVMQEQGKRHSPSAGAGKKDETSSPSLVETNKHLAPNMDTESIDIKEKLEEYQKNVEHWFQAKMDLAKELYRKKAVTIALLIGFLMACMFNIDSVHITHKLWKDPTLRLEVVALANAQNAEADLKTALEELNKLPVGWDVSPWEIPVSDWPLKLLGFFITGLAAAQGSPFWFDVLRRLGGLKSDPAKSQPTQSPASG